MFELAQEDTKIVARTILYMFKWESRDMEDTFKRPKIKLQKVKSVMSEMKSYMRWDEQCIGHK